MGTVTTLPRGRPLKADDLDAMPDDGHRYELIDGTLIVTPSPLRRHQGVSLRLSVLLDHHCPDELRVATAPLDVKLSDDTVLQPDLLVVRSEEFRDQSRRLRPLLAVEIVSPSTRRIDLTLKRVRYEAAGCPAYWVIDPDAPALTAWELQGGQYVEVAHVAGEESWTAATPFEVTVMPAELVR